MNLVILGVNHKTTPVELRERIAFDKKAVEDLLKQLISSSDIQEAVILSTCNRVELYSQVPDIEAGLSSLKKLLYEFHEIPQGELDNHFYEYHNQEAVSHLFRVSSSLDSMVVGEPQILGQVKDAYTRAQSLRSLGMLLNQLFEKAFSAAKKVRADTSIAESAVSISFVAVELAKKIFDDLSGKTVMIIGAGEMAEIAARHLLSNGVKGILVANRTFETAVELAKELEGSAIRFNAIEDELIRTDIIISSAGAPHFIIKKEMIERMIHHRRNRPMFFIDISVPRNIEPKINEIENVYLYDIDDLQVVIESNMKEREKEAVKAEEIVNKEVKSFMAWMDTLEVVPTITALREMAESIRLKEMEKTFSKLGHLPDETRLAIDNMSSAMISKILHGPTVSLKKQAATKDGYWYVKVVRELFKLT